MIISFWLHAINDYFKIKQKIDGLKFYFINEKAIKKILTKKMRSIYSF